MERAVVCIGVSRSGDLPVLRGVYAAVDSVRDWALTQGIHPARVRVLTDELGRLSAQPIKDAIRELLDLAVLEQLIVYFAGHGVNNRYNEYWLLSDAPADPQAAVSLSTSVDLARYAGIPHVVFISDACRTAPDGIAAQYVTGSDIFPNRPESDLEADIDMFFATTLGQPAHEARDPLTSASRYTALYTQAMIEALAGRREEIVEVEGAPPYGVIRPRAVKRCLMRPLSAPPGAGAGQLGQVPDARITSGDRAWLSMVAAPATPTPEPSTPQPTPSVPAPLAYVSLNDAAALQFSVALHPDREYVLDPLQRLRLTPETRIDVVDRARARSERIDDGLPEALCGFVVRGGYCVEAHAGASTTEIVSGALVRVDIPPWLDEPVDTVHLTFEQGTSALLPAIPEFVATVTLDHGDVVDVSYEPSEQSIRWQRYDGRIDELRRLRAAVSTAAYLGVFAPDRENLDVFARQMQVAKGVDPTMAIYAAYAYRTAGRRSAIDEMARYFRNDLRFDLFDVSMLGRSPHDEPVPADDLSLVPPFPLLSQGWSLMRSHALVVSDLVRELEPHVRQSLWTTFDGDAYPLVHELLDRRR